MRTQIAAAICQCALGAGGTESFPCPIAAGHEEIERLERLIVKDFQNEARTHKEKLLQNHRVADALKTMQQQSERMVSMWFWQPADSNSPPATSCGPELPAIRLCSLFVWHALRPCHNSSG